MAHATRVSRRHDLPERAATAAQYFPARRTLPALRRAAALCRACPLWERGTQTVFGEGPPDAPLVLVGEQPGDAEDRAGRPFVGPAGRLLDRALAEAGLSRDEAYVTNAVKHFKWVAKGKRRLHTKPSAREVGACLPWLEQELELLRPRVVVLMGPAAAQALLGRAFRLTRHRGEFVDSRLEALVTATVHPAAILRAPTEAERRRGLDRLVADLQVVATALQEDGRR
ncbi:MAG: UdgX family uracil-DNA binding protein [Planctomycetes bacterium]|nr:UdgX family uracil-DNA binding protein [Planctomycetota bacterium]